MKRVALAALIAFVGIMVVGPVGAADPKVDWGQEFIKTRGLGSFKGEASSRKLIIAREKAKVRAERDILGIIKEMNIDSNTTIKETMEDEEYSEVIERQIKGTLRGAQILTEGQLNKNTYEVIVGVKISDVRKALLSPKEPDAPVSETNPIIIPSRNYLDMGSPGPSSVRYVEPTYGRTVEPTPPQPGTHGRVTTVVTEDTPTAAASTSAAPVNEEALDEMLYTYQPSAAPVTPRVEPAVVEPTGYEPAEVSAPEAGPGAITSLIVDGRRLNADRAFWPRILGPGQEVIYGDYDASIDFLQDEGAVAYATNLAEAKGCARAGANPLVVKAVDVYGKYKADLVLDADTAAQVNEAEGTYGFLKAYKVMFVLN